MAGSPTRNYNFLTSARDWLVRGPHVVLILAFAGLFLAADFLAIDLHRFFSEAAGQELDPERSLLKEYLVANGRKYYVLGLLFLLPAFMLWVYRIRHRSLVLPFSLMSLALLLAWLPWRILYPYPSFSRGGIGEEPSQLAFFGEIVLVCLLILSPPFLAWLYHRTSILNRYMVRSFLSPFSICLFAFISIWLIIDLGDNVGDFAGAESSFLEIGYFYIVQLPQVLILVLPVTILLSLLYSLGRMSSSNELISMIGFGKSTKQIFAPLFAIGLYMTFLCFVLNYHWAPWSEGHKDSVLKKMSLGYETKALATNHLHHNAIDRRTWFISFIPFNMVQEPMAVIEIRELDDEDRVRKTYYAYRAKWDWRTKNWSFIDVTIYRYNEEGVPEKIEKLDTMEIPDWSETPFKLVSSSFNPEYLGIPQLTSFLRTNRDHEPRQLAPFRAHWHYRWSLPWSCFVVTLVAAPLGIVYSRRGLLGSVAAGLFIFFSMFFLEHFFLALGQGNHMPAFFAAWSNNFLFAAIGGCLLYYRSQNRALPGLDTLKGLFTPKSLKA